MNEVGRFVNFGYAWGIDAPGLKLSRAEVNQIRYHVALAHGLRVQAIRASGRAGTKVGVAENIAACVPAIATPENIRATEIATRELNAGFLGVVLEGKYTDGFLAFAGPDAAKFTPEELKPEARCPCFRACALARTRSRPAASLRAFRPARS